MCESVSGDGHKQEHGTEPTWKIPALFCAMHHINYGKYLRGDEAPDGEKLQRKERNNSEIYLTRFQSSATSFRSYKLLSVRALHNLT